MIYDAFAEFNYLFKRGNPFTKIQLLQDERVKLSPEQKVKCYKAILHGEPKREKETKVPTTVAGEYQGYISKTIYLLKTLELYSPLVPPLAQLPPGAVFIQFKFSLAKPYFSRDDEPFWFKENPIRKDKVFKVPMISPTSWKGNLRSALRLARDLPDSERKLTRLFGNERGAEGDSQKRGRLHFYPTFFERIALEVINPHDRKTKAGTQPIYFEIVPPPASGMFSLLYSPFDLIGSESKLKDELPQDLALLSDGIVALFSQIGFSAKKTSGFGQAEDKIREGFIITKDYKVPVERISKLPGIVSRVCDLL